MSKSSRGEFSSSFGFVMAAAGSAIGLGNVWGFPTQTAQNGGAAFVRNGIEKWSSRLMPTLLFILLLLVIYVLTLDGAMEGLKVYLLPDFDKVLDAELFSSALGQAFFSLSLGVGSMLVLASYTSKKENLVRLGRLVTLSDVGIAFLAGLLILPAMYAAAASGTRIFDETGNLISGPNLIFQVLPELFKSMGSIGMVLWVVFFFLMTIAALTSTISMLEVPVAYAVDNRNINRTKASILIGLVFWAASMAIALNFDLLFGVVVTLTTEYIQPLLGLFICIFVGWVMDRNALIGEIKEGNPGIERTWFMRIWPVFVRYVAPILILIILFQAF
jgi:NSS family neurotransmitter:Na+ symporter